MVLSDSEEGFFFFKEKVPKIKENIQMGENYEKSAIWLFVCFSETSSTIWLKSGEHFTF